MRPIPLTARKAGAVLAALMLSTALTACQPQASAASTTPPTSAPTPTAPASEDETPDNDPDAGTGPAPQKPPKGGKTT